MRATALRCVIIFIGLATVGAHPADAATYHVWGCHTPSGAPASTDGWGTNDDAPGDPAGAAIAGSCASGGGLSVIAGNPTGATYSSLAFHVPQGLRMTGGVIRRFARVGASDPSHSTPTASLLTRRAVPVGDNSAPFGSVVALHPDERVETDGPTVGVAADPLTDSNRVDLNLAPEAVDSPLPVAISASCSGTQPLSETNTCDARYVIAAYDFVLSDDTAPVVKALGGTLLDSSAKLPPTSSPISGKQSIVVVGSDQGSGVYRAIVRIDGAEVASGLGAAPLSGVDRCRPSPSSDGSRAYTARQPCPADASPVISWDSAGVPDGRHQLQVLLEDAAGNQTTALTGQISTRNSQTTGPGSPLEFRGDANGSSADDASILTAGFPNTARAPSKKASVRHRCHTRKSWAARHQIQCTGRAPQAEVETSWSAKRSTTLAGTLTDSGGAAVKFAKLQIQAGTPGSTPRLLGDATTDSAGRYSVQLSRADGTQAITVQWLARTGDNVPAATAAATMKVKADVQFAPPRAISAGHQATFRGSISAVGLPADGRTVSLQYRRGGAWATFAEPQTDQSGHWIWKQRLSQPASYRMRVLVRTLPTYPFEESTSKERRFTVR